MIDRSDCVRQRIVSPSHIRIGKEEMREELCDQRIGIHEQQPAALPGRFHLLKLVPQQNFMKILLDHQLLGTARIVADIPADLCEEIGVVGERQILSQRRLSGALPADKQNLLHKIRSCDHRNLIPVSKRIPENVRRADRNRFPVKINHGTMIEVLISHRPPVIRAAEDDVHRFPDFTEHKVPAGFPFRLGVIFLLGCFCILQQNEMDIFHMLHAVVDPAVPVLHGDPVPASGIAQHNVEVLAHGSRLYHAVKVPDMQRVK